MSNFILGLDLDGVCFNYTGALRDFLCSDRGHSPEDLPDPTDWDFTGWPLNGLEDYKVAHTAAVVSGIFASGSIIEGASESLWRLSNAGADIHIITNRFVGPGHHKLVVDQTMEWLDNHDIPFGGISFIKDKTKVDVDVLLEDAPHNLLDMMEVNKAVIAFDTLYNRHVDCPRVMNWVEAEEMIRGMMCQKLKP